MKISYLKYDHRLLLNRLPFTLCKSFKSVATTKSGQWNISYLPLVSSSVFFLHHETLYFACSQ